MTHAYEFHIHDARTLAELGEIHPRVVTGQWTRSAFKSGSFRILVPRTEVDLTLLAPHNLVEVIREGAIEFTGVVEKREIDPLGKMWTLSGPDLKGWWLKHRIVGAADADDRTGIAEDVMTAYVNAHLVTPSDSARRAQNYLIGKTFTADASGGRGGTVTIRGRRKSLIAVVEEIALLGDLLPQVEIFDDYSGYHFFVGQPFDATQSSGGVPFGVDWDNVESLKYVEDYSEYKNHLWIMGEGTGDARNFTEVSDATSIISHFRREAIVDARDATTEALRLDYGMVEHHRRDRALVSVQAVPLREAAGNVYREDWDVGWYVTFLERELRSEPIDVQVVAATVELTRAQSERISFELGQQRATSQMRRLEEAIRELRVASFE